MRHHLFRKSVMLTYLATATAALAQSDSLPGVDTSGWETNTAPPLNRINFAYRMGYLMTMKFKGLGGFPAMTDPGPSSGTHQDHYYDDGYVLRDTREVNDHYTWNWGFSSPGQVSAGQETPYGSLTLHSSSSPATAVSTANEDPQHGMEFTYLRQLGTIKNWTWGMEGAFNFTEISAHDTQTISYIQQRTTDTYALDGLNPYMPSPAPANTPYMGQPGGGYPGGGGPLIIDEPASRVIENVPGGATIVGDRQFTAYVCGFHLGPYLRAPLGQRWAVSFSGGLAVVVVNSSYTYTETVTLTDAPGSSVTHVGSGSHSDFLAGGYAAAQISYALRSDMEIFAGAEYQNVGLYKQSTGAKEAEVQLDGNLFVNIGLSFSF
jgi:hypothetical protein